MLDVFVHKNANVVLVFEFLHSDLEVVVKGALVFLPLIYFC
jgi:hypothetical protein